MKQSPLAFLCDILMYNPLLSLARMYKDVIMTYFRHLVYEAEYFGVSLSSEAVAEKLFVSS
jgi:hypothetical protein